MKVHIVVEGQADEKLLRPLLADCPEGIEVEYLVAGGKDAARPRARLIQRTTRTPIVFVVDSDDPDRQRSAEQKLSYESYFRSTSGGTPFYVAMMVPSIETLLFRNPELLPRALKVSVDKSARAAAAIAPRETLQAILGSEFRGLAQVIERIPERDLQCLQEQPEIQGIRRFLAGLTELVRG